VSPAMRSRPPILVIGPISEPNEHNRALAIVADSNSFYRSTRFSSTAIGRQKRRR
jgi:hypothetical protein